MPNGCVSVQSYEAIRGGQYNLSFPRHGSWSQIQLIDVTFDAIRKIATAEGTEIADLLQQEARSSAADTEPKDIETIDVVGPDRGARIRLPSHNLDVAEFQIARMSKKEAGRRKRSKHVRLGISRGLLRRLDGSPRVCATSDLFKI